MLTIRLSHLLEAEPKMGYNAADSEEKNTIILNKAFMVQEWYFKTMFQLQTVDWMKFWSLQCLMCDRQ